MNVYKNEHIIKLGGQEILLRPTFENIAELETMVKPVANIALALTGKDPKGLFPLTLCAKVIYFCQADRKADRPSERKLSLEEIWIAMQDEGIKIYGPLTEFMAKVTAGNSMTQELTEAQKKS